MVINIIKLIFSPDVLTSVQIRKTYNKHLTHLKEIGVCS